MISSRSYLGGADDDAVEEQRLSRRAIAFASLLMQAARANISAELLRSAMLPCCAPSDKAASANCCARSATASLLSTSPATRLLLSTIQPSKFHLCLVSFVQDQVGWYMLGFPPIWDHGIQNGRTAQDRDLPLAFFANASRPAKAAQQTAVRTACFLRGLSLPLAFGAGPAAAARTTSKI